MSSLKNPNGMQYWRSLDELTQTPEFLEAVRREFPEDEWDRLPPATRRQFLKVMGASLAFAGLTGCRWPEEEIVPFAHRPSDRTPGVPQQFATAMELAGVATGMLVTSYDGRPIKAEGNPEHPDSLGGLGGIHQASILGLYDPDRSRRILHRDGGQEFVKTWDDVAAMAAQHLAGTGQGVAVLTGASSSPSLERMKARFLASQPAAEWYEYEPISSDNEREGLKTAFGRPLRIVPDLGRARVVVCLDADPLGEHPAALRLTRQFAGSRNPNGGSMSRLWVAEAGFSLTGGRADNRLAVGSGQVAVVLSSLVAALAQHHEVALPAAVSGASADMGAEGREFVAGLADDLIANRGHGLVMVGPRQPAAVHALAAMVNEALGNVGTTLSYIEVSDPHRPTHADAITKLSGGMASGAVRTLLILGGNPAYDAPAGANFAERLSQVPHAIHLSLYDDETSRRCSWHLPQAHFLESWGDGRALDGTLTLQQPLIEALYGGRSALEVLAMLLEPEPVRGYDIVRETMREMDDGTDFEAFWRGSLHDGLVRGTASPAAGVAVDAAAVAEVVRAFVVPPAPTASNLELVLVPDSKLFDGRFANNGWLQELPESVTKISWDNALLLSPPAARELGVIQNDVVTVTAGAVALEVPVCVVPGQARYSASLWLGYGRTAAGQVGDEVGADAYRLRAGGESFVLSGVSVRPTGRQQTLACTQDHFAIDTQGFGERNIRADNFVREASLDAYLADPELFHHMDHHPPLVNLWQDLAYEGEQWGMSIDLNACTGCNACVVACQAENNIPVVGRDQVINQREMQWIRIDRYFKTPAGVAADEVDTAEMVFQPMTCVQCENAPCEQVCPVAATQHTRDGLNAMAYNRCIGTRYCSNNCPFKVRRFNFFNYHKNLSDVSMMQFNPEVTVRSRGVMEKCTFCIQRIETVRISARNDKRPIADGEIVPACAQTCPARAIHFGDLNNPESEVSRLRQDHRAYVTLEELNIRPRAHYMARLQNPAEGGVETTIAGDHDDHGKESG